MKCLFLLGLLAVSSVWALPNSAKENEGEKLTFNERSKREVAADAGGKPEGERDTGGKGDVEASGGSSELDLDVDINVGGSRGKSDIDISVNVGSANGEKTNLSPKEQGKTEPCDCVGSLRELADSLDEQLDSLVEALGALKEKGEANNGTAGPRASSSAVAVVESLKSDISRTVQTLTRYWVRYCRYFYYYYYGWIRRCWWVNYRKRRDVATEIATEPVPEPELMPSKENGSPVCIVGDLVTILMEITDETSKVVALTEQAANDASITADLLLDIDELIDSLENQKEMVEDMKNEIEEIPC